MHGFHGPHINGGEFASIFLALSVFYFIISMRDNFQRNI